MENHQQKTNQQQPDKLFGVEFWRRNVKCRYASTASTTNSTSSKAPMPPPIAINTDDESPFLAGADCGIAWCVVELVGIADVGFAGVGAAVIVVVDMDAIAVLVVVAVVVPFVVVGLVVVVLVVVDGLS
jgi:hypothetical protein